MLANRDKRSWLWRLPGKHRFLMVGGVLAAVGMVVITGCGGSSSPTVVRSGANTAPTTTSSTTVAPSTSTTLGSSTTAPASKSQRLTVTPSTDLKSSQTVSVEATGFSPGEQLVVTECAAKGTSTGPADCNLAGMQPVAADTSGKVSIQFNVVKGPFGGDKVVCGAARACLISVTQATPSPTQEADAPISFAG